MLPQNKSEQQEIYLLLNDIRSTHNVGSIFRTADAAGVTKIYISGYTPSPIDRFGRERSDISKASLGAEKTVPYEVITDSVFFVKKLKKEGVTIIGLEQDETSQLYTSYKASGRTLIILGNEVGGVDRELLGLCDHILEIPMYGSKESLNVSVAVGILLYGIK